MIGYNLITHQTTKKGLQVKAVLIDDVIKIKRELYIAIILDRKK
jgi:succinyl-CoA synthetase beta subunit